MKTILPLSMGVGMAAAAATNATYPASLLSSGDVDLGIYDEAYQKAVKFAAKLTTAQKVSVITGSSVNGTDFTWTALENKDGFAGINSQYYVSAFPMGNALTMTWSRQHATDEAKAVGREFYLMGYNLINGPVASPLGRTPYGGRLPEGFSPDPYLSGVFMDKTISGMNSAGVVSVGRHFLMNEQETNRSSDTHYSSNADDKTIHELYLWPFVDAVRASSSDGPPDSTSSSSSNSSMSMGGGGGGGGLSIMGTGTTVAPSIANYASDSEVCLVFMNSWSGEGGDRSELSNEDQDALVVSVAENCNNTIVVINTAGPRVLDAWVENDNVTAVIYGGYLGQESGNVIVDVLYGDVNPNGKLIASIAKNATDYPVAICDTAECDFDEGVHIDYRYFDANNVTVRYPFGHGLSYTTFKYGDVSASKTNSSSLSSKYPTGKLGLGGPQDLFDDVISVKFTLKNTGDSDGAEVAQLYVEYPAEADQPPRQLRGFEKVALSAGEQQDVEIQVRRRDISYWDTAAQKWALAEGDYTFSIGSSSRDLRSSAKLSVL